MFRIELLQCWEKTMRAFLFLLLCLFVTQSQQVVLGQKKQHPPAIPAKITVYYLPFTTETFGPYTPDMLRKSKLNREVTDENIIDLLYQDLHRQKRRGRFDR